MADDLLARLRNPTLAWTEHSDGKVTLHQESLVKDFGDAADEIERLRAMLTKAYRFISPLSDPPPITNSEMANEIMRSLEQGSTVTKIHESEYGDSSMNFHVAKRGAELHVDLTYPPRTDADNKNDQCRYVCVNQEAVRASDGVRLHYDYERDGFVVEQPRPRMQKLSDNSYDSIEDWIEVGFFQSWRFDVDQDEQFAAADAEAARVDGQ